MHPEHIQDRVRWGMNVAARAIGLPTDAYRPKGPHLPLAEKNRFLRLPASFTGIDGSYRRPLSYGEVLCQGIFDAAYTQPGDYLRQQEAVWYVASQQHLLPVLCVRTSRTVSFLRPTAPSTAGAASYGGITAANTIPLMTKWPAGMLSTSREARPLAGLPGDNAAASWTVLLPVCQEVVLKTGDLMTDDLGRSGVIATTELTDLGWRLVIRQATT